MPWPEGRSDLRKSTIADRLISNWSSVPTSGLVLTIRSSNAEVDQDSMLPFASAPGTSTTGIEWGNGLGRVGLVFELGRMALQSRRCEVVDRSITRRLDRPVFSSEFAFRTRTRRNGSSAGWSSASGTDSKSWEGVGSSWRATPASGVGRFRWRSPNYVRLLAFATRRRCSRLGYKMGPFKAMSDWLADRDGPLVLGADINTWADPVDLEPADPTHKYAVEHAFVGPDPEHRLRDAYRLSLEQKGALLALRESSPGGPLFRSHKDTPTRRDRVLISDDLKSHRQRLRH